MVTLINLLNNVADTFWSEAVKEKIPYFDCIDFWECIIQLMDRSFYGDSILVNTSVAFDE